MAAAMKEQLLEDWDETEFDTFEEWKKHRVHNITNPMVWWRHPIFRIYIAFMVLFLDFVAYGEDPIPDSHVMYNSVGTGEIVGLLAFLYAPTWYFMVEKFILFVIAVALGYYVIGKGFQMLMIKCGIRSFNSDGGYLTSVLIGYGIACFIMAEVYNAMLGETSYYKPEYEIDAHSMQLFKTIFGLPSSSFLQMGVMWQYTSSAADWMAIFQLLDCVFQDDKYWVDFCPGIKKFYCGGNVRKLTFWVGLPIIVFLTGFVIHKYQGVGDWQIEFAGGSCEAARAILAGIIVCHDLFFVVQDWEFPLFAHLKFKNEECQTKIMGTDSTFLEIPKILSSGKYRVSPKWMQYGPIAMVGLFDLLYLKSMLQYEPKLFGQYVDPSDYSIWVIRNETFLNTVYPLGAPNETLLGQISYEARRDVNGSCLPDVPSCCDDCPTSDYKTMSKYSGTPLEYVGLVIGAFAVVAFGASVKIGIQTAESENHPGLKHYDDKTLGDDDWDNEVPNTRK